MLPPQRPARKIVYCGRDTQGKAFAIRWLLGASRNGPGPHHFVYLKNLMGLYSYYMYIEYEPLYFPFFGLRIAMES